MNNNWKAEMQKVRWGLRQRPRCSMKGFFHCSVYLLRWCLHKFTYAIKLHRSTHTHTHPNWVQDCRKKWNTKGQHLVNNNIQVALCLILTLHSSCGRYYNGDHRVRGIQDRVQFLLLAEFILLLKLFWYLCQQHRCHCPCLKPSEPFDCLEEYKMAASMKHDLEDG